MEYEKCYVFEPEDCRPAKKRKLEPQGLHRSWPSREKLYEKAWRETRGRIDANLNNINQGTIKKLIKFLDGTLPSTGEIATAFISTGAEGGGIASIINELTRDIDRSIHRKIISVSAGDGANLKALLKSIIRKATSREEGVDEEDGAAGSSSGKVNTKLLNYDLKILANHVKAFKIRQITITFQDTEAFDSDLLSELVELLGNYRDRIPVTFIFCLATSVEFLQQRLSRRAVQTLSGQLFDLAPLSAEVEQVFEALIERGTAIWIGPAVISMLFERQNDYIQSIDTLVNEIQYAYMSSYYANALTIFLDNTANNSDISKDHYTALRCLPSFRDWIAEKVDSGSDVQGIRGLLENDFLLRKQLEDVVNSNRDSMSNITVAAEVVRELQRAIPGSQLDAKSKLYIQAMSNRLKGSSLVRALLLSLRKSPSNVCDDFVKAITQLSVPDEYMHEFEDIKVKLSELIKGQKASEPLRSEDDVQNSTLRTTVVAQKVELSKQKSTLSKQDAAYTDLLRRLTDILDEYFDVYLIDPKSLLFHEVFMYDLKSPHREVFMPRPRHAIERALAAPHDYLDCDCCAPGKDDGDEQTLSASQPATAILYQLYLESGSLINASDLWQAFQAVVGDERTEEQNMALFQRALAELKYLGLVKNTRKRVDHVAKIAWKGL